MQARFAADTAAGFVDARNLIAEIAHHSPAAAVDPQLAGLVMNGPERVRRAVQMCMRRALDTGGWSQPLWSQVFITDQRLIIRPPGSGSGLLNIWWSSLVGFEADLAAGHVICDFGEGMITALSGPSAAVIAVEGIYVTYGAEGLQTHPALGALRAEQYLRAT